MYCLGGNTYAVSISPTPHGLCDLPLMLRPVLFLILLELFWPCPTFPFTSLHWCCSGGVYNMLVNMAGPCVCPAGAWAALFLCSYITLWTGGGGLWEPESPWAGNVAQTFPASIQTHWWVLSATSHLCACVRVFLFCATFILREPCTMPCLIASYCVVFSTVLTIHCCTNIHKVSLVMGFKYELI